MTKFTFSKEEQEFLSIRNAANELLAVQSQALNDVIQSYIVQKVIPRLGIDMEKSNLSYNIAKNELTVDDKPAEETKTEEPSAESPEVATDGEPETN
ncbi:MAG: hypothetical protein QME66_04175 [Candidatus Eisenbacteria bacterium]|nr:hypothetical protein [Candidatus Eisenbacteria bacterium]